MNWYRYIKIAQQIWEQHKKDYAVYPEGEYSDERETEYQQARDKRMEWERAVDTAISLGQLTEEEAKQRGYTNFESAKWAPLPEELYHVTTAKSKVIEEGLKTRRELSQSLGGGLGGGTSDAISFTTNLALAQDIYRGIKEMMAVSRNDITIDDLLQRAATGADSKKPFLSEVISYYQRDWQTGMPIPLAVQFMQKGLIGKTSYFGEPPKDEEDMRFEWTPVPEGGSWEGGDGKMRYMVWTRPANEQEKREQRVDLMKKFMSFRQYAGGPEDPMFFLADTDAMAEMPESEVAILQFQPAPGAMGWPVSGMEEWRVPTGTALIPVKEIQPNFQ